MAENEFDDLPTFEDGEERESELKSDFITTISETVTWSTDWTIGTIFSQIERETINLDPLFQRRDAWNMDKKSRFIESVILGLPIPQLVLAEDRENGTFIVVDGKQRLTTICQFLRNILKLRNITFKEVEGKTFSDISRENPKIARNIENLSIRSVILRNWPNEDLLYSIFYRLNSGSLPLSPQELRAALKPGPLMGFLSAYAETSIGISHIFKRKKPDPRMKDVELLLRFISFNKFAEKYNGSFKDFLDSTCDYFNSEWDSRKEELQEILNQFENSVSTCLNIFRENTFKRYSGIGWENRFSRAVFDILTYYIDSNITPELYDVISAEYIRLCKEYPDFLKAISSNTNNMPNTSTRFKVFGESLSHILGGGRPVPSQMLR